MKPQLKVRQRFVTSSRRQSAAYPWQLCCGRPELDACAGVLIPGEMDEIGSDDPGFAAIALMVASGLRGAPNYV
jgi:hypothetical protein